MKKTISRSYQSNLSLAVLLIIMVFSVAKTDAQTPEGNIISLTADGGELKTPGNSVCLTDDKRSEIQAKLKENITRLRAEGKLAPPSILSVPPSFTFPVKGYNNAALDYGVHGISNFVDQNPAFPNMLLDYNCGMRTYDLSSGYNHKGVDIFSAPFSWNKMDNQEVAIIAADAGTIIYKSDGNFDRNCGFGSGNWNAVYLSHADGTVSWYGHMKSGSLTAKTVGTPVAKGEYLGIVGSSGNSTGPHLHFELYNPSNALQDPFSGACNSMNAASYWDSQPAYRDSKINKLMTHSAPPVFPSCPSPEIVNEKKIFAPGSSIITAAYYRDQTAGQTSSWSLIKPDGSTHASWTHTSPSTYSASYWYYSMTIPASAPTGTWKLKIVYDSATYEKTFTVQAAATADFDFDGDAKADISVFRPSTGNWYISNSSSGAFSGTAFGLGSDLVAPADFDGDGKTDIAVFRPSNGNWYWLNSSTGNSFSGTTFGSSGDYPVPADYDGDGRADIAVFRPSNGTWYILYSQNGQFVSTSFGTAEDKPTLGDFDGDGKADIAVYRPSNGAWYRLNSSTGAFSGTTFGISEDKPAPADFDGDGKTDISVFRPSNGTWYRLNSSTGAFVGSTFGLSSDKPTAADFDGDGKADIAVYRPSNGAWYRLNSSTGAFVGNVFGITEDVPTPNSFVR